MDGNYSGTLDYRIAASDTIFFLHFPRLTCLWGVFKRRFLVKRIDDIPGCPERIDFGFFSWIWNYNKTRAPQIYEKLERLDNKKIYILKNRKQLQKVLKDWPV